MASYYSDHGRLSEQTLEASRRCKASPNDITLRRNFYLTYLADVVPWQITAQHIPTNRQPFDLEGSDSHPREEIRLMYQGKIFMVCVVHDRRFSNLAEEVAGNLAHLHWSDGKTVNYARGAWRMFTAGRDIRFCISQNGRDWVHVSSVNPILQTRSVVQYFRGCLEKVTGHEDAIIERGSG